MVKYCSDSADKTVQFRSESFRSMHKLHLSESVYSIVVEYDTSNVMTRVRFPVNALKIK